MQKDVVELSTIENPTDKLNLPSFGTLEDLQKNIANQAKTSSEALQGLQTQETDLEKQLTDLLGIQGTQSTRQSELEKVAGVPDAQKRMSDITSQLAILGRNLDTAQIQADTKAQGTLELKSFLDTTKQNIRNQAAIQSNRLLAEQAQLQGNVETAQRFIESAIEAEFAPIKTAIDIKTKQLDAIRDDLTREEQKEWNIQSKILDEQLRQVEHLEEVKRTLAINGAPTSVLNSVTKAEDIYFNKEALKYMTDPLDKAIKNKQLEKLTKEIKALDTPVVIPAVPGSKTDTLTKIINSSLNKGDLTAEERGKLEKMQLVVDQLDTLQNSIAGSNKTGLIKGRVNKLVANLGADAEAGTINAQLQALVPSVARGIYGEVGVLTNADVENYKKTLPNLTTIEQQNDLALAMTLKNAQKSYENVLRGATNSNMDVSGWAEDYSAMVEQVAEVEDRIGLPKVEVESFVADNPDLQPMIAELIATGMDYRDIKSVLGI